MTDATPASQTPLATAAPQPTRRAIQEDMRMAETGLTAHEADDAMKFKALKHEIKELKHELEEEMGNCSNGFNDLAGLAALGLMWDRNRDHGYRDEGCRSGERDLLLSNQIADGNRGVTNDVNNMATLLHEVGNHNSVMSTIQSGNAAIQQDVLEGKRTVSEQSLFLQGEICRIKEGQADISRDVLKADAATADRICSLGRELDAVDRAQADRVYSLDRHTTDHFYALSRAIDGVDRHQSDRLYALDNALGDRLCGIEKTQLRDTAALSRQMQECCCEIKMEGMQNTQRVLDEIRCNREKELENKLLALAGELSQKNQTADIVNYLIKSGVVPTAA